MSESVQNVSELFSLTKDSTQKETTNENWQKLKERVTKEVKGVKWTGSKFDIIPRVAELLDIKIPTIFLSTWKKSDEIKKILKESASAPEEKFELNLSQHEITSEHKPYIEVSIKNMAVYKIEFDLNLTFTIEGFFIKIQNGNIYQIDSGICKAKGTLSWEKIQLLEKSLEPIKLPGSIQFN
jgi:hypothetical protein